MDKKKRILITGAAGRVGRYLSQSLTGQYDLVLTDKKEMQPPKECCFIKAELTDLDTLRQICLSVHTVVHLAANPNIDAIWEDLYPANIVGTYNLFQAAYEAGCRRIIFASSINAVGGYAKDIQIDEDVLPRPPNLYGATKVWGEAVGRYYADQKGLSVICLRLGWVVENIRKWQESETGFLNIVLTNRDMAQLISRCIAAPDDLRFSIYNGLSNNRCNRLDISKARSVLGYKPQDDAYALAGFDAQRGTI